MPIRIAVFASSSEALAPSYYSAAQRVGEKLAAAGYTIVFGGGNRGLMGALATGALERGGRLVGVIPRGLRERGYCFEDAAEIIATETLAERKALLMAQGDAFVVLPGGFGTLDEFFDVVTEKQLGYHDKPILLMNIDSFFLRLHDYFTFLEKKGCITDKDKSLYSIVETDEELLALLQKHFHKIKK